MLKFYCHLVGGCLMDNHATSPIFIYITCSKCLQNFYRYSSANKIERGTNELNHDQHDAVSENELDITPPDSGSENDNDPDYIPAVKKTKDNTISPKTIPLPIICAGKSHSSCCVCKKRGSKLIVLPAETRYRLFIEKECLLVAGSRCCAHHLLNNYFDEKTLNNSSYFEGNPSYFNKSDIMNLVTNIRSIALRNERSRIDFDNDGLDDSDNINLTGITKADFDDVCSHVVNIRNNHNRTSRTCIALLLVKLRSGLSNKLLSTLFNMGKSSVQRALCSARKDLSIYFTPKYIGFDHITRKEIILNHTRPLTQELFGNTIDQPAILILDGTYIYIQKSNNFAFQRRSYSMHKNRPLVKPMIIVSSTGYIISILGPYLADSKNNDAGILKHSFKSNMENMNNWVQSGDIFIVDRGFRDASDVLESLGIKPEMPKFLPKGQKQFSTENANASRMVTKIRWVVESVNGRIKQWKYLHSIIPNSQIPYIGDHVKLVGAICNKYRVAVSAGEKDSDQILAAKMKVLARTKNELQERVEREGLHKRSCSWTKMEAEDAAPNFPRLSEEDIRNLTVGVYQLKLAKSYTQEHLNDASEFVIMINSNISDIHRVQIQSRHTSARKYMIFIEFNEVEIKAWYCQCKSGSRVVGTCSHVASVVWYLGCGRYMDKLSGVKDWTEYVEDAGKDPVLIDES